MKISNNRNSYICSTNVLQVLTYVQCPYFSIVQLQNQFSVDEYSHYLFTPRDLTQWIVNLQRYDLSNAANDNSSEHLLEIWAYEARRLFRDKIVGQEGLNRFDRLLMSIIQADWSANIFENLES